jgi:hypothetical protein
MGAARGAVGTTYVCEDERDEGRMEPRGATVNEAADGTGATAGGGARAKVPRREGGALNTGRTGGAADATSRVGVKAEEELGV